MNAICAGILSSAEYTTEFRKHRKLCLSILKRFGFGQRSMETRILIEAEEMIARIQAHQGRPFDVEHLVASCVANVIMNMVFGRRRDHSCPEFQQMISDSSDVFANTPIELETLPILRSLPYYKKKMADNVATMKRMLDYINLNIAACHKVCHRRWGLSSRRCDASLTRMWANAQPDGRPAEHRWRPLFNAPKFG